MGALLDRHPLLYRACHPVSYIKFSPLYTFRHIFDRDGIETGSASASGSKLQSVLCFTYIFLQAVFVPPR